MPERDPVLELLRDARDAGMIPPELDRVRARVDAALQDEFNRETQATERRRPIKGWWRRAPRLPIVPAVSGLVTLAVAVAAIVLLAHRAQPRGGAASPRSLISALAVLRRPQTIADRLPARLDLSGAPHGAIIPSLTRLVAHPPGTKLFLVVMTPAAAAHGDRLPPLWSPTLGDQAAVVAVTAHGATITPPIPAVDLTNAQQIAQAVVTGSRRGAPAHGYNVSIVPDGVAYVRWTFAATHGQPGPVIDAQVQNNVAFAPLRPTSGQLLHATWSSATGTVIPGSQAAYQHALHARQAVMAAQDIRQDQQHSYQAAPALLADFAVFAIDSSTGTRTSAGNIVSHPWLSALPVQILNITSPNQPPQLDPKQIREVTTPSGERLWIVPGRRGLCVAVLSTQHGQTIGSGEGCSANLHQAETRGAGLTVNYDNGSSTTYRVVPKSTQTITVSTGHGTHKTVQAKDGIVITHRGPNNTHP